MEEESKGGGLPQRESVDYSKIHTISDCAEAMKSVMSSSMRNGEKQREMQALETLYRAMEKAQLEEERLGNERKTAVKKVVIEFITPSVEDLTRVMEMDEAIREGDGKNAKSGS